MSQEKVERYKEEKANRKEILKKEKRNKIFVKSVSSLVALAFVFWIGISTYNMILEKRPRTETEVDVAAIEDYMSGLSGDEEDGTEADGDKDESSDSDQDNKSEKDSEDGNE